jgi:enoyl-CoA hydratase
MSGEDAELLEDGPILTLWFRRPEKLNAINASMESYIVSALTRLENDPSVSALVIRSEGEYFSAGYDLRYRVDDPHDVGGIALRHRYRQIHDLFDRMERVEKPVVLAAQGPCLGGALEMALSCDFRLASDRARFAFPEIRLAVIPGSGGTSRTTRLIGPAWARWMVMAGRSVSATQALQIGLVHDVYPPEDFEAAVDEFMLDLASRPQEAMALAKLSIDLCDLVDRSSGRDIERIANSILMPSVEHQSRLDAAKARQSPGPQSEGRTPT